MTDFVPPKKNDANGYIFYVALSPQAATGSFQTNPTLASGDVKISKDGGAFANLATLPAVTPASGIAVKVTLSQSEINADNIVVLFVDAAGAQWCDHFVNFQTTTRQLQDLAYPATTGRSLAVSAAGAADANVTQFGGSNLTASGGRPEVNTSHIAGSAVSTSSAQIGVNVVNAGGTAWGSGAITANSIAGNAITSAKIATDAIGSAQLATGAITTATFAAGAINAAAIADNAIDAGAIAADAITAAKVASDVGTEIGTAVWGIGTRTLTALDEDNTTLDLDATIRAAVGLASANLDTQLGAIDTVVDAILVDTGTTLPGDLAIIAGYIDTEIGAVITALGVIDGNVDTLVTQTNELWQLAGLDIAEPVSMTTTTTTVGDIELAIGGDGETTSTIERQP